MTRAMIVAALLLSAAFSAPSFAKDDIPVKTAVKSSAAAELHAIEEEWARIKYQVPSKDQKLAYFAALEKRTAAIVQANPGSAEAKIWQAIVLATDAGVTKSLSGLSKVELAKDLLEQAIKINPKAMDGAAYMTLGSLYYQVPGWPIGYGSDELAEKNLKAALAINPDGMDTNYWYGMFLLDDNRSGEAVSYLKKAVAAPARPDRKIADEGRRHEAEAGLAQAVGEQKQKARGNE